MNIYLVLLLCMYILPISFICLYSFTQLTLVWNYVFRTDKKHKMAYLDDSKEVPHVTVQLPLFNELYVAERLIDAILEIDYPKDKFEIQVLDDSTDETVQIVQDKLKSIEHLGFDIVHITRVDRKGYKAGALHEGMEVAKGEFIAIFDADFLPRKDFLKRTIPYFLKDRNIGVVQSRWDHINLDYSVLTKVQGFALDAHFSVEQSGRNVGGHFINFNGTAGVWRKVCIEDAGGWQSDTLTEDLDLSYRAQLKGWKFQYLEALDSPAELPVTMNALKQQQFRWTKGAAEVAKKLLMKVLRSDVSFRTKFHAFFHLLNSSIYVFIFALAIISVPVLFVKQQDAQFNRLLNYASGFIISLFILGIFYYTSLRRTEKSGMKAFFKLLYLFPTFLAFSMGMSLHNSLAVIEGYRGKKSPFMRTPKFNIFKDSDSYKNNKYLNTRIKGVTIIEFLLSLYFFSGILYGIYVGDYALIHFHLLLSIGFGLTVYYSVAHTKHA